MRNRSRAGSDTHSSGMHWISELERTKSTVCFSFEPCKRGSTNVRQDHRRRAMASTSRSSGTTPSKFYQSSAAAAVAREKSSASEWWRRRGEETCEVNWSWFIDDRFGMIFLLMTKMIVDEEISILKKINPPTSALLAVSLRLTAKW